MIILKLSVVKVMGFLFATVLVAGCQSLPRASYDYAEDTEFSDYVTFSWISDHSLRFHKEMDSHTSPLLEQHLENAAILAFAGAGLKYVDNAQEADVLMAFTVGSREMITRDDYYGYYGAAISGDSSSTGYWTDGGRSFLYVTEGRVCVDLFDRLSQQPIWHGMAEETLDGNDMEYWRNRIPVILQAIVSGYPPN